MVNSIDDRVKLSNGIEMPWLGLGVFKLEDTPETTDLILNAIEIGYRSIDTASAYNNEKSVGDAVNQSPVKREELFITSKVWNADQGYQETLDAFEATLERLKLSYLDLYLVHWPVKGKYTETWKAMEKLYSDKKVKAIGVCNFLPHHLDDILSNCKVAPMVNQAEFHPYLLQNDLLEYCNKHNIQREASVPLMKGKILTDPVVLKIAEKYNKSTAQIILKWDLQHGVITIPKSANISRIKANTELFDFVLTKEEMDIINSLDRDERVGPHPDKVDFGLTK